MGSFSNRSAEGSPGKKYVKGKDCFPAMKESRRDECLSNECLLIEGLVLQQISSTTSVFR
jgi:hypothetical protein